MYACILKLYVMVLIYNLGSRLIIKIYIAI